MTESIGKVPITSINEVEITSGKDVEELDLVDDDTNFILTADNLGNDISIQATLIENLHYDKYPVEKQREEVKSLVSEDAKSNDFSYNDFSGFISVSDIDVSENSDLDTIREVDINGKYLPHPQHFPEKTPASNRFFMGDIKYALEVDGEIFVFYSLSGNIEYNFNIDGEIEVGISTVVLQTRSTEFGHRFGRYFGESIDVSLLYEFNIEGDISKIQIVELNSLPSSFGRDFGRHFGEDGPSLTYDFNIDGELGYRGFGTSFGNNFGE